MMVMLGSVEEAPMGSGTSGASLLQVDGANTTQDTEHECISFFLVGKQMLSKALMGTCG